MVSTFAMHRDSLRETLFLRHAPHRRNTTPATASAERGKQGSVRARNASCGQVREVLPNPSVNRTLHGLPALGPPFHSGPNTVNPFRAVYFKR
jgi:hypothetical protein